MTLVVGRPKNKSLAFHGGYKYGGCMSGRSDLFQTFELKEKRTG
jgi:hypothetical protein